MAKTPFKYTLLGQMLRLLRNHAGVTFLFLLFSSLYIYIQKGVFMDYLLALIGAGGYLSMIYTTSAKIAADDKKPTSPAKPNIFRGFILPAVLTVLNIFIVLCYQKGWNMGANGPEITSAFGRVSNTVAMLWFSTLRPLAVMEKGFIPLYGYAVLFISPIIASAFGYLAGLKKFSLLNKLKSFIYEK